MTGALVAPVISARWLSLLAALSFVIPRAAAGEAPRRLTLAAALAEARAHQPRIRRALAEVAVRLRDAAVPRAAWYPQLGAGAQLIAGTTNNSTTSFLGVPEVDLVRIGGTPMTTDPSWRPAASTLVALTLNQQIYDFGRIAAQAAVADALVDAARADAEAQTLDVLLGAEEAFFAVLAAHEVEGATEDAYQRATAHRELARAGVRTGMRPPIELTRVEAEVAQLEVRRVRAKNGVDSARAALAAAIGSDARQVDAAPTDALTGTSPALDEALAAASQRNPFLRAALLRLAAQQAQSRAVIHDMLPNLFASASLSGRGGGAKPSSGEPAYGDGWLPSVPNWHIGLVLQWNLFDAVVLARRDASRARAVAAQAEVDVTKNALQLAVQRAFLELDGARRALDGLLASERAAQANLAQAEARFRNGLGTTIELADAEALVTNAQLELAIGRFAVARTRAELGRAMGQPSEEARP